MRVCKPTYGLENRGYYSVSQDKIQNAVDALVQIPFEQMRDEWRAPPQRTMWSVEDLLEYKESATDVQATRKARLVADCPGLFTGPGGSELKQAKTWLPVYLATARNDSNSDSETSSTATPFQAVIGLWAQTGSSPAIRSLSLYCNHMGTKHSVQSFSKGGLKMAIQVFQEYAESVSERFPCVGHVSVRVNQGIGTLRWKKLPSSNRQKLRLVYDDLRPRSVLEWKTQLQTEATSPTPEESEGSESVDEDDDTIFREKAEKIVARISDERLEQRMAHARDGELCFIAIGVDERLSPASLLAALPSKTWHIPEYDVTFFIESGEKKFYRCGKVETAPRAIGNRLSINFGFLRVRGPLAQDDPLAGFVSGECGDYGVVLARSVSYAFRHYPDLAEELAFEISRGDHKELPPNLKKLVQLEDSARYRAAFSAAARRKELLAHSAKIELVESYESSYKHSQLAKKLGLTLMVVSKAVWELVTACGAFHSIPRCAELRILAAEPQPPSADLERLRAAIATFAPTVPSENVSIRISGFEGAPMAIYDHEQNVFAFASPPPNPDSDDPLHWAIPFLECALTAFDGTVDVKKLCTAYAAAKNWAAPPGQEPGTAENPMDIDSDTAQCPDPEQVLDNATAAAVAAVTHLSATNKRIYLESQCKITELQEQLRGSQIEHEEAVKTIEVLKEEITELKKQLGEIEGVIFRHKRPRLE
ncbi:unnamed protein product [Mycena citricolor]|uniref:Uncharacterized protein n=1 Tax=Mycena citricolor TaxID=2018698 RepID=A0AAD2Q7B2_9AGAR|nr:unnamed protein product [Mycena citricolor]